MEEIVNNLAGLGEEKNRKLDEFARMIEEENKIHNLTRIVGLEVMRVRHFEDSLVILPELEKLAGGKPLRLIDIGSGAGLPGLAIAIARPEWSVTSVDSTGKKIRFQQKVITELGLANARAVQGRAEEMGREAMWRETFDAVTARAVGELAILAELALPLARVGGRIFAWKGPGAEAEMAAGRSTVKKLGGGEVMELPYKLVVEGQEVSYRIIAAEKVRACPKAYPRLFKEMKLIAAGRKARSSAS
jgi:16S rRNA (guanine527-N7)-methyltransferase